MATIEYTVPSASLCLATILCDDPRNTVLMMPPPLSHCCLEGGDRGRDDKYCGDGLLGYGDDELSESECVWEQWGGES